MLTVIELKVRTDTFQDRMTEFIIYFFFSQTIFHHILRTYALQYNSTPQISLENITAALTFIYFFLFLLAVVFTYITW